MCDLLSVNSPSNSPINARKAGLFKLETLKDFHFHTDAWVSLEKLYRFFYYCNYLETGISLLLWDLWMLWARKCLILNEFTDLSPHKYIN